MNTMPDNPLRILIVEDEPGDLGLIQIHLRRAGYGLEGSRDTLLLAGSLEEAREKLGGESADLVLLDLSLPDSHGLDTVVAMRKLLPGVPIIVMSGNTDLNTAISALQQGALDYLVKGQYNHESLGKIIRHALERSLLENRLRLLEAALKATSNAVLITDMESRIEWTNPAFTRLTGYTPDEVQGKVADNLCLMVQEEETEAQPWYAILAGAPRNREGSCRRKDGSTYQEELIISPVPDARGRITHFIAVKQDITERKQAEAKLQAALQRNRMLFESSRDALMTLAPPSWKFTSANKATLELFGATSEAEFTACGPWNVSPEHQPDGRPSSEKAQEMIATAMQNGSHLFEWEHCKLNGTPFPADVLLTRMEFGCEVFLQATVRDISERKQAEGRMKESLSLLQATLESTTDAILVVSLNRTWSLYNRPFVDLWNIPPALLESGDDHAALEYVAEQLQEPEAFLDKVRELYAEPEASSFDIIQFKDGRIIERHSIPQHIDGKVVGRVWSFHDVTAYKQAEEKLHSANRLLNNVVENIPNMIFMKEAGELRFDLFNRAGEELLGQRRENLIGRNDYDFFPKEQADFFTSKDREVLAQDGVMDIPEEPIETPRGTRILHTRKIAIRDERGQPQFLLGISNDITERKQAEEALHKSKLRLQSVMAASSIITYALDTTLMPTFVSDNVKTVTGFTPEEVKNSSWWSSHLHPEDRDAAIRSALSVLEKGESALEYRFRYADGSYHWIYDHMNVVRGDDGQILEIVGTWSDITPRKQAEEDLRIAAVTFESQNGTIVTDVYGRIIRVNKAFTRLTGYAAEEAIGKTPAMLQSGIHDRRFYELMWESLKSNGYWQGEIWNKRKNGEVYAEWLNVTAVFAPGGRIEHYVGTFHEITEQLRMQELVQHMAHHDPLTDLPNRTLFSDRLQQALAIARRGESHLAVMFIDLDKFKPINDELGHEVGDQLLKEVTQRMQDCVRESDTVARIGGDEFVVLLPLIEEKQDALRVAEKIRHALNQPFMLDGRDLHISSSTGVVVYPEHGENEMQLMKLADVAMYHAKSEGRNRVVIYQPGMQDS